MNSLKPMSHRTLDAGPTLPPEAEKARNKPDLAQLAGVTNTGTPPVGNIQSVMMALQMGATMEATLEKLSELIPSFAQVAAQIIPLLRGGLRDSVLQTQGGQGMAGSGMGSMMGNGMDTNQMVSNLLPPTPMKQGLF